MSPQDKCALSFYRELEAYDDKKAVQLCRHIENQRIYLKKIRSVYNRSVYEQLKKANLPFVPKIEELIEDDEGRLIIIEEYISGKTLEEALAEGVMEKERAARIITDLAEAISVLQSLNPPVVHRDLKPENIILNGEDRVVLIDFNTAKHITNQSTDTYLVGTQGYAAPEQFGFGASGEKTDVYALGIIFNEMLTGHSVWEGFADGEIGELIRVCVSLEADRRPSIRDVCEWLHRWMMQFIGNAEEQPYVENVKPMKPMLVTPARPLQAAPVKRAPEYHPNRFPGFRSGNPIYMIVSVVVTLIVIGGLAGIEEEGGNENQWLLLKSYGALLYFFTVIWCCNYRNIRRKGLWGNAENKYLRLIGAVIIYFLVSVISLCIFAACSRSMAN